MLQSFRSRLVLSNLLVTLVGLLIVGFVFTQLLVNRSTDVKRSDRRAQAQNVSRQVEAFFASPESRAKDFNARLRNQVNLAANVLGARIIVRSGANGNIIADSKNVFTNVSHPLDRSAYNQRVAATRSLLQNPGLVFFQAPLRGHIRTGKTIGAIVLIARVQDVQLSQNAIVQLVLTVLGSALLVWLLISIYFAISISRPLVRITEATAQMAAGDYSVRVHVRGDSEISRLAVSFNNMAQKVQETNRLLRDFVANVSHDLRTPLTMITGFSDAMLDGTAGHGEMEASAAIINEEAVKMQRLVDDLLQLTKLESGLLTLQIAPVELRPLVGSLLHRVTGAMGEEPMPELVNGVPATLPAVALDSTQFERALRNLIDNAMQYTPPSGSITVGASVLDASTVAVTVSDTGKGIPEDELSRIFERFYRSDRSRERSQGHAGLGLAIVREVIEAHGGTVSVTSEPGRGTIFTLTLPRAARRSSVDAAPAVERTRPAVTRG
jgi:signal transduction histidine kinase